MSRYIVFDLEMCRVPYGELRRQFGSSSELIQIGAVMLDDSYEVIDTFMTFVRPEYGFVDSFIEKLTGITGENVADAPFAAEAITSFFEWIPEDSVLVSWSENDIDQIYREIDGKGIEINGTDDLFDRWIDCQEEFGEKMNSERCYNLSEALNITAIYYDEGEHDALVDARNTAMLFKKIRTESKLQLSPYLIN